ncbi:hypothetical protein HY546_03450 [archaeon]|nr:hypothetical protein [archaeon]
MFVKLDLKAVTSLFIFAILAGAVLADTRTTTITVVVATSVSHSIAYGGSCSSSAFYLRTDTALDAAIVVSGKTQTNRSLPYDSQTGGAVCQSQTVNALNITNTGNVLLDLNASLDSVVANISIKVSNGNITSGTDRCGTSGTGGWQIFCDYETGNDTTSAPTKSNCRNISATSRPALKGVPAVGGSLHQSGGLCFFMDTNNSDPGTYTRTLTTEATAR